MARAVTAQVADGGPRLCGEVIRPRPMRGTHGANKRPSLPQPLAEASALDVLGMPSGADWNLRKRTARGGRQPFSTLPSVDPLTAEYRGSAAHPGFGGARSQRSHRHAGEIVDRAGRLHPLLRGYLATTASLVGATTKPAPSPRGIHLLGADRNPAGTPDNKI